MKSSLLLLSTLAILTATACSLKPVTDDASNQALAPLIGKWAIGGSKDIILEITRTELAMQRPSGERLKMGDIVRVDASRTPNEINLHNNGDVGLGIYQ